MRRSKGSGQVTVHWPWENRGYSWRKKSRLLLQGLSAFNLAAACVSNQNWVVWGRAGKGKYIILSTGCVCKALGKQLRETLGLRAVGWFHQPARSWWMQQHRFARTASSHWESVNQNGFASPPAAPGGELPNAVSVWLLSALRCPAVVRELGRSLLLFPWAPAKPDASTRLFCNSIDRWHHCGSYLFLVIVTNKNNSSFLNRWRRKRVPLHSLPCPVLF